MSRILLGELHELPSRTSLWNVDACPTERLLENLTVLEIERNEKISCAFLHRYIRASEEDGEDCRILLIFHVLDKSVFPREEFSSSNSEKRNGRIITVTCVTDDVAVTALYLEDHGRLFHPLDVLKRVTHFCRALEVE